MEGKYKLDVAVELDVRMWQIGSMIEAKRINNVLNLEAGGLDNIIKTINFMSWAPSFGYEYELSTVQFGRANDALRRSKELTWAKGSFPAKLPLMLVSIMLSR